MVIIKSGEALHHPYSITFFQKYLYWTDWEHENIYYTHATGWYGISELRSNFKSLIDIHAYDKSRQADWDPPDKICMYS